MRWWHLITDFQALLALAVTLRVFLLGIKSVRRVLVYLLLPTMLLPLSFALSAEMADYRKVWIVFAVVRWTCDVGAVYAFTSAAFHDFRGPRNVFRKGWTLALVASLAVAVSQSLFVVSVTYGGLNSLGSLLEGALQLDRGIATLVGFALFMLVGIVLYSRVPMARSVLKVGIGMVVILNLRTLGLFAALWAYDAHVLRWMSEIEAVLWTACLAYWSLFLSSNDEVDNWTLIARI